MDIEIARHLYLLQKDSAIKKGVIFRINFADWCALWGKQIDQRGGRPGDLYMERINKSEGYVLGNLRISKRLMR